MSGVPTSATTIQRADLAQLMWEYNFIAAQQGFVGARLLPFFPVPEQSADYPFLPFEAFMKVAKDERAADGSYNENDWQWETKTYSCKDRGIAERIDDSLRRLYSRFFDIAETATQIAYNTVLKNHEIRVAALLLNTGTFANAAAAVAWSTPGTATPLVDIKGRADAMFAATGLLPNSVTMGYSDWSYLTRTTEIKNAFGTGTNKEMGPFQTLPMEAKMREMAAYFEVDQVLVSNQVKDSAKKGQSKTVAQVWTAGSVFIGRIAGLPDSNNFGMAGSATNLKEPVVGRTFQWEADAPIPIIVEEWRDENRRSDMVRARTHIGEVVQFAGAGQILTGTQ
jgi:hypothetical protein